MHARIVCCTSRFMLLHMMCVCTMQCWETLGQ